MMAVYAVNTPMRLGRLRHRGQLFDYRRAVQYISAISFYATYRLFLFGLLAGVVGQQFPLTFTCEPVREKMLYISYWNSVS